MKFKILMCVTAITLFAALAVRVRLAAQEHKQDPIRYTVIDLGTLGGAYSLAGGLSNSGWVEGRTTLSTGALRPFLWRNGKMMNLGTLGGLNSDAAYRPNERGDAAGGSENGTVDPHAENYCGYGTDYICLPFFWSDSLKMMTPLPTLGGNNGWAAGVNDSDEVAGNAENTTKEPTCVAPQFFQFKPVIWEKGEVHELPTFPGDPVGQAYGINSWGQITGYSGNCVTAFHALLWQNGSVINLGNLGGVMNNEGVDINNQGQVTGQSDLKGDLTGHAFLWEYGHMKDLGTLLGDYGSDGDGINDEGQVVGGSWNEAQTVESAIIWQNGVMTDLNTLIPPHSPLYLVEATGTINDQGWIAGVATQIKTGHTHAFLLIPTTELWPLSESQRVALPENVRNWLQQRHGSGHRMAGRFMGPR
jgi:probable HAF family extracellular repeat protein